MNRTNNKLGLLQKSFDRINTYLSKHENQKAKLLDFKQPHELNSLIDFGIGHTSVDESEFLHLIDQYLNYSVNTGHKQFLNQLFSGFNLPAFIGEVVTSVTNTSMYTYEVAPVATLIETEMIKLMNTYTGYSDGDGIFLSGGSNANLLAMLSARNRAMPRSRFDGYNNKLKLTAFVNEQAHYSFDTAANIIGIGSEQVVKVRTDDKGRIIPQALQDAIEASIRRGEKPFFVAATCATTLLGAYDPIDEMVEICRKHRIWLHADGSFGGSLILSEKHRHMMKGIEKTDSFAWNPHKLMNIPLICSVILVRHKGTLQHNLTDMNTNYIFHEIDLAEDLGKKSIQCGRRVDAVKLWFAWKYFGLIGYQQRIDNLMDMAVYAEELVRQHPSLELMAPRQSFTVCFRYIPQDEANVNEFNLQLRETLRKTGQTIVNYGYIGNELTIRLVTANGELERSDIDLFFNRLSAVAKQLEQTLVNA